LPKCYQGETVIPGQVFKKGMGGRVKISIDGQRLKNLSFALFTGARGLGPGRGKGLGPGVGSRYPGWENRVTFAKSAHASFGRPEGKGATEKDEGLA